MYNVLRGFDAQTVSNYINPYAVDVIRAKRRDLVYGISHTEDLLDLLVTEGVMTAAKRSIILTIGTRTDQNSRVLDILEARGERACRKFFHPCLMLSEPDLYQRVRTYVEHVNKHVKDTKRQLIGYLLEKEKEGISRRGTKTLAISQSAFDSEANEKTNREDSDCAQTETIEDKAAQGTAENLMYTIATDGDLALLEELLDDTNINSVTSSGETLLHVAAKHGHLSITELLIRKGARIDLHDNNGRTALHDAASRGHTEIVRSLLNAGAPMYSVDLHNKTPIHLAAENEHHGSVKALVKEEKEEEQTERQSQDTFLHMAAVEDNWRLAELLLQSGATVDARNNRSQTALFYAVARGNENTVAVLLRAGAKVDGDVINEAIKRNQESILHLLLANAEEALSEEVLGPALFSAVKQNQHATVTVLTDNGANVNVRDKRGYTPLLLSAELGHTEVFRVLLAKQAKIDATLSDLSSALHLAVHSGSLPIVQTLLEKGLDPNVTGPKAQNPLHLAAQCNRSDLVGVLVKAGAQVNAVAQDGLTPLHLASQRDHADTVIQLLQNKADSGLKDRQGRTALHWAASCHGGSRVVDLLLSAKADPAHTDNKKKAALHLAAMAGNLKAVNSLLSRKAKGDAKDMDGSTALHYAAAGGHACVVSALLRSLSNKKGIEERNAWRKTPLQAAAEKGHDSVAVLLLEAGAKVNTTDHSKDTPLHCAARGGHQEVVKRLVNWGQAAGQRKVNLLKATNNVGKTPLQVAESGDTAEHEAVATLLRRKMFLIK